MQTSSAIPQQRKQVEAWERVAGGEGMRWLSHHCQGKYLCNYCFNDEGNDSICTVSSEKEIKKIIAESVGQSEYRSAGTCCNVIKIIAQVVFPDKMWLSFKSRL